MKKIILIYYLILTCALLPAQTGEDLYRKGSAQTANSLYDDAIATFAAALDDDPSNPQLLLKRGEAYFFSGNYDAALSDFSAAGKILPGLELFWMAKCYAMKGETGYAIRSLRAHLSSAFRLPQDEVKKDPAFDRLQLTEEWYDLWQEEWYTAEENTIRDAFKLLDGGRYEEALSVLNSGIRNGMRSPAVFFARGSINYEKGNYAAAVSDFTTAISGSRGKAGYYFARGYANLKAGNPGDAASDFTQSLRSQPDLFRALLGRAEANAAAGSYSAAVNDVRTYLRYFENDQEAVFLCGNYLVESGSYLEALRCFNIILEKDQSNALYFRQRGRANLLARTYRSAIYDLSMSLDLDPADGRTYLYLGIALLESGNREDACSAFEKSRRLGENEALRYIIDNCH